MSNLLWSRRMFLVRSALGVSGAMLASVSRAVLLAMHREAKTAAAQGAKLRFLTPLEAADLKAFAAQVLPTTDTPGANEADVVYFIDRALVEFEPKSQPQFRQALAQLDEVAKRNSAPQSRFADLAHNDQVKVITILEKMPSAPRDDMFGSFYGIGSNSFDLLRSLVVAGFLSDPELGGNKEGVGWKLIGFDAMPMHEPPFGYYDAELLKKSEVKE